MIYPKTVLVSFFGIFLSFGFYSARSHMSSCCKQKWMVIAYLQTMVHRSKSGNWWVQESKCYYKQYNLYNIIFSDLPQLLSLFSNLGCPIFYDCCHQLQNTEVHFKVRGTGVNNRAGTSARAFGPRKMFDKLLPFIDSHFCDVQYSKTDY